MNKQSLKAYTNMIPYYIFLTSVLAFAVIFISIKYIQKSKSTKNKRRLEKIK